MGCFSFLCKKCGKGIQSTSFSGHKCRLALLKDGKVIQEMQGEYDSYGRVFIEGTQAKGVEHDLKESAYWDTEWRIVCDLMFDKDKGNGIAAYHSKCDNGEVPVTRSEDDPNQGWGEEFEDFNDVSMKYSEDS